MAAAPIAPGYARANTPCRAYPFDIETPAPRVPASLDSLTAAAGRPLPAIEPAYPGHGARMAALLALEPRREIEVVIEILIAMLDTRDGDPDMEDDDPAHDPLDVGEFDEAEVNYRPLYGLDQTAGPVNEKAMWIDHRRKVMAGMTDAAIIAANRATKGFLPRGAA